MLPVKDAKRVVKDCMKFCKNNNITLIFDNKRFHLDGDKQSESSAYFVAGDKPLIKVSTKSRPTSNWVLNLLHEVCHAEQFLENSKEWQNCFIDGEDVSDIAGDWVARKRELTPEMRKQVFDAIFELEKDAEIRTVRKIIQYGLHRWISIEQYTKEAWAYINGYKVSYITRSWIPAKKAPYRIPSIVEKQPKNFTKDPYKTSEWILPFLLNYPELFMGKKIYTKP